MRKQHVQDIGVKWPLKTWVIEIPRFPLNVREVHNHLNYELLRVLVCLAYELNEAESWPVAVLQCALVASDSLVRIR